MLFNNDKKNLPEDLSGQRTELSPDDLNQVTGGMPRGFFEELGELDKITWESRDDYIDALQLLKKKYQRQ